MIWVQLCVVVCNPVDLVWWLRHESTWHTPTASCFSHQIFKQPVAGIIWDVEIWEHPCTNISQGTPCHYLCEEASQHFFPADSTSDILCTERGNLAHLLHFVDCFSALWYSVDKSGCCRTGIIIFCFPDKFRHCDHSRHFLFYHPPHLFFTKTLLSDTCIIIKHCITLHTAVTVVKAPLT